MYYQPAVFVINFMVYSRSQCVVTLRLSERSEFVLFKNEERRTRGPRVGHNVFYNEVQKKLVSRLFLSLGTDRKKRFLQKNPHAVISKMSFRENTELEEVSFQIVK